LRVRRRDGYFSVIRAFLGQEGGESLVNPGEKNDCQGVPRGVFGRGPLLTPPLGAGGGVGGENVKSLNISSREDTSDSDRRDRLVGHQRKENVE